MPANSTQFPSSAPIWGIGQNAVIQDFIDRPYVSETTDAPVFAITPSDGVALATPVTCLLVGVAGDVTVVLTDATTVTLPALAAGVEHKFPFRITQVKATGTTATGIVGYLR